MKKLLLILFLLPLITLAQDTLPDIDAARLFTRQSIPDKKLDKFGGQRDILITGDGKTWLWKWSRYHEISLPFGKGEKGDRGDQGLKGDKGDTGDCSNCPPTSGGGDITLPFHYVKPHGSAQTLSQAGIPTSNYPGINASGNDMVDWANLQYAVKSQESSGLPIWLIGQTYFVNRSIQAGKYQKYVVIYGNYGKIQTTNSSEFSIFGRPSPTDNSDANVMILSVWDIENLRLYGSNTQIGIEPGPTYGEGEGSWFKSIIANGLKTSIHGRFCLNMDIFKPSASNCTSGWIADMGNWQGATNSNSQSNNTRIYKPRWYGSGTQDAAIKYLAASGGVVDQPIIEGGGTLRAGIDVDGKGSSVVKDFAVINGYHFENVNGATEAALKVRLASGRASLDGYFGQYATIVVDAGSSSGNFDMDVSNLVWAVGKNNKLFRSSQTTWTGSFNNSINNSNFANYFEGTPPQLCGGLGCGGNRFNIVPSPR